MLFSWANQLTLSLLGLLDVAAGADRPRWRLRNGQACPPRLRGWSALRPLLSDGAGLKLMRLAFGSFASWIIALLLVGRLAHGARTRSIYEEAQPWYVGHVGPDL
jgi:hypothetical protein